MASVIPAYSWIGLRSEVATTPFMMGVSGVSPVDRRYFGRLSQALVQLRRQRNLVSSLQACGLVDWPNTECDGAFFTIPYCVLRGRCYGAEGSQQRCHRTVYGVCHSVDRFDLTQNLYHPQDEPFHVPQAQAYCNGEWSTWDPKITTPPGLYVSPSPSPRFH